MFSLQIVDSDAFLDMPTSSQLLYFHLSMRADDDGFVDNPKKIMRAGGSSEDDLKVLKSKRFILSFESGVIVIKHWKIHNYIQKDRYTETKYLDEKNGLTTKGNGSYTECIQNVSSLDTQVRLGKDRLGKVRIEDMSASADLFAIFWEQYPKKEVKRKTQEIWKRKKLDSKLPEILVFIEKAILTDRWKKGYIKQPSTFLNGECWEDDLKEYGDRKGNQEVLEKLNL